MVWSLCGRRAGTYLHWLMLAYENSTSRKMDYYWFEGDSSKKPDLMRKIKENLSFQSFLCIVWVLPGCGLCSWVTSLLPRPSPTAIKASFYHKSPLLLWDSIILISAAAYGSLQRSKDLCSCCTCVCRVITPSLIWSFALFVWKGCFVFNGLIAAHEMLVWLFCTDWYRLKGQRGRGGSQGKAKPLSWIKDCQCDDGAAVKGNGRMKILCVCIASGLIQFVCVWWIDFLKTAIAFFAHVTFAKD